MRFPVPRIFIVTFLIFCFMSILSCSGKRPPNMNGPNAGLAPCPSSPNCVSSNASDADHRVEAFELSLASEDAWSIIHEEIKKLPRTTVVEHTEDYIHAEFASAIFGFVDDLQLQLHDRDNHVAIRSASRIGYSDMGVNRERVEQLRKALRARGVVK